MVFLPKHLFAHTSDAELARCPPALETVLKQRMDFVKEV